MSLSSNVIVEKNSIGSVEPFLIALDITIPGVTETVHIVRNTDDITWRGFLYKAIPFEISELNETSVDEVPNVTLSVSNVDNIIGSYVAEYDLYNKQHGFSPIDVVIYIVSNADLTNPDPVATFSLMLLQPSINSENVVFTLGAQNPFIMRFPLQRMMKDHCRYKFRSPRCGYKGDAQTCNKTLAQCREYKNNTRFGGFPGIGKAGLSFAES
jgi:lambda family phage minor tail protein L